MGEKLNADVKETIETLQMMRDEIRVKLHLAGMDAKDKWKTIEPKVDKVEGWLKDASQVSKDALHEVVNEVKSFRDSII